MAIFAMIENDDILGILNLSMNIIKVGLKGHFLDITRTVENPILNGRSAADNLLIINQHLDQ